MPNPYVVGLERELSDLRSRRVAIRKKRDQARLGYRVYGDPRDPWELARVFERELKATETEWQRLHHELGRSPPGPAIKIAKPDGTPLYRSVQPAPVRRAVPGYMTKVMMPGR